MQSQSVERERLFAPARGPRRRASRSLCWIPCHGRGSRRQKICSPPDSGGPLLGFAPGHWGKCLALHVPFRAINLRQVEKRITHFVRGRKCVSKRILFSINAWYGKIKRFYRGQSWRI